MASFQMDKVLSTLFYISSKLIFITIILIFTEIIKGQSILLRQLFIGIYIIERIVSTFVVILQLNPDQFEKKVIFWMIPLSLDEFYLRIHRRIRNQSDISSFNLCTLITIIFLSPIIVIAALQAHAHQTTYNLVLLTILVNIYFLVFYTASFIEFDGITQLIQAPNQYFKKFAIELVISLIHFNSYFLLIAFNLQQQHFLIIFLSFNILRIVLFAKKITHQIQYNQNSKVSGFIIIIQLSLMQLFHIIIDQRAFNPQCNCKQYLRYRPSLYNKILAFSFPIKILLVLSFIVNRYILQVNDDNSFILETITVLISLTSTVILSIKFYQYILRQLLKGKISLEIEGVQQLKTELNQHSGLSEQNESKKYSDLQFVYLFLEQQTAEIDTLISTLFSKFQSAQIISESFLRLNFDKISSNQNCLQQNVIINREISCSVLFNTLIFNKLLPQITQLTIQIADNQNILSIYSLFANSLSEIKLQITNENTNLHISILNKKHKLLTECVLNHILAFKKFQSDYLYYNPNAIIYDLFEGSL